MSSQAFSLSVDELASLFRHLVDAGYEVVGPRIEDGELTAGRLRGVEDLPRGWVDEQAPARHRTLEDGDAFFGYAPLPDSFKRYRFPPRERWPRLTKENGRLRVIDDDAPAPPLALLGLRPCDLAAMRVHDQVFEQDDHYARREQGRFVVAVACTRPGGTCFCASMGTGPGLGPGFDLGLTELASPTRFVLEVGSEAGQGVVAALGLGPAAAEDVEAARAAVEAATEQMGRALDTADLPGLLRGNLEHPRWAEVGARCLACGNCTMVCPTCFCNTVEDRTDVSGTLAERVRRWDSCFSADFSYLHGGVVRETVAARYRQWLTHKLDHWHDQFGALGCVGCGRCITWCPVGIDLTEEVAAIRGAASAGERGGD